MEPREHTQNTLELLRERLGGGRMRSATRLVHSLTPTELARLLESLPPPERALIWQMVDPEHEGDVLVELAEEVRDGRHSFVVRADGPVSVSVADVRTGVTALAEVRP